MVVPKRETEPKPAGSRRAAQQRAEAARANQSVEKEVVETIQQLEQGQAAWAGPQVVLPLLVVLLLLATLAPLVLRRRRHRHRLGRAEAASASCWRIGAHVAGEALRRFRSPLVLLEDFGPLCKS